MRLLSAVAIFFLLTSCQTFSPNSNRNLAPNALPLSDEVFQGKLSNGISYYFQPNFKPKNKAFITLLLNVGSLQEEDGQEGIAHFVEHMAFNGTQHFDKKTLITKLESLGMAFGSDINAFTSQSNTRYHLEIPTDDKNNWLTVSSILSDWIQGINFKPQEVDQERQVILAEKRTYQGLSERVATILRKINFADSHYARKLPIGTEQSLANINAGQLKAFHKKWYQPHNMAIIVTGDIKAKNIFKRLDTTIGQIKSSNNLQPQTFSAPALDANQFKLIQDPEILQNSIQLTIKDSSAVLNSKQALREHLKNSLIKNLFNNRLSELTEIANKPFEAAGIGFSKLTNQQLLFSISVSLKDDSYFSGYQRLITEINRVKQHGFIQAELDRYLIDTLKSSELSLIDDGTKHSSNLTSQLMTHFINGDHYLSTRQEDELLKELLPSITLAEINQRFTQLLTKPLHSLIVYGPDKLPITQSEKQQLRQRLFADWYSPQSSLNLAPYIESSLEQALLEVPPTAGSIVSSKPIKAMDSIKYHLSNGATVIIRPSALAQTQVLVSAFSPGGYSLASLEQLRSAIQSAMLVAGSGIGPYNRTELGKKIADKSVRLNLSMSRFFTTLNASSTPDDLKTLFELIHLYFSQPKMDPQVVENHKQSIQQYQKKRLNDPEQKFSDELHQLLTNNHPFSQPWNVENALEIDADKALDFYKQRFNKANNFTFVITGNFNRAAIEALIEQYIASLPASVTQESWQNQKIYTLEQDVEYIKAASLDNKTKVHLRFHKPIETYIANSRLELGFYQDILQKKLEEELREKLGGVYSVSVNSNITRLPTEWFNLNINFNCDPKREEELIRAVESIIKQSLATPLPLDYIESLKKQYISSFNDGKLSNKFWLSRIFLYERHNIDYKYFTSYIDRVKAVSASAIQNTAQNLLKDSYQIKSILRPKP